MLTPPDLTGQVLVSHKISEGVFAEVFVGHLAGGAVAVKIPKASKKGAARAAEREIRAMQYVALSILQQPPPYLYLYLSLLLSLSLTPPSYRSIQTFEA